MTAEKLAREIIDKLNEHEHASYEEAIELVAEVVAPLVSDAEKWRKCPETVHIRTCHNCKNVAVHADNTIPYVTCTKCGSNDTRRKRGDT